MILKAWGVLYGVSVTGSMYLAGRPVIGQVSLVSFGGFLLGKYVEGNFLVSVNIRKFLQYMLGWGDSELPVGADVLAESDEPDSWASAIRGIVTEWNRITGPWATCFFSFTLFFSSSRRVNASSDARFSSSVHLASSSISFCVIFRCVFCARGKCLFRLRSSSCCRFRCSSLTSCVDRLNILGSTAPEYSGVTAALAFRDLCGGCSRDPSWQW